MPVCPSGAVREGDEGPLRPGGPSTLCSGPRTRQSGPRGWLAVARLETGQSWAPGWRLRCGRRPSAPSPATSSPPSQPPAGATRSQHSACSASYLLLPPVPFSEVEKLRFREATSLVSYHRQGLGPGVTPAAAPRCAHRNLRAGLSAGGAAGTRRECLRLCTAAVFGAKRLSQAGVTEEMAESSPATMSYVSVLGSILCPQNSNVKVLTPERDRIWRQGL